MELVKYKVLQASVEDGVAYIPEDAILLGVWPGGISSVLGVVAPTIAFMMKYEEWPKEEEEAKKTSEDERLSRPLVEDSNNAK